MDWLEKKLADYIAQGMHSFHTPGHKGRNDILARVIFPDYDLTELPGLDMLHTPCGVIAEAQKKAAAAYGAEETFFLVNGGTSGNQAMMLSLMSGLNGKKVRIERKAHRSVFGALILSGIIPEYILPVVHPDFNLPLGLDVKEYMNNPQNIGGFFLTIPSYFGTVTDLNYILEQRDGCVPDIPVLVDQAHGSHFQGALFPRGAVAQGADIVLHSTHKTLAALTQAGMLHVQGKRINRTSLKKSLELLQTSSPSYLLMASLEKAVNWSEQRPLWENLYEEVKILQQKLDGRLRILTNDDAGKYGIKEVDWAKILVNVSTLEITTMKAVEILRATFKIEPELWDDKNILFLLGIGNTPEEVRHLCKALEYLVQEFRLPPVTGHPGSGRRKLQRNNEFKEMILPPMHLTPREAWLAPKRLVEVRESLGLISGETISIYPPGIPLIVAGEEITSFVLEHLLQANEYNWQGWEGFERGRILVANI